VIVITEPLPPIEPDPNRGRHLRGPARRQTALLLRRHYRAGKSITRIAAEFGRSYGLVYNLLREVNTKFRPRSAKKAD
jgi:transposase